MYDETTATIGGEVIDKPIEKPKTRAQRIEDWRKANYAAYQAAMNGPHNCCSPTRHNQMIIDQYNNPPID
jgi:hypothetical protein